MNNDEKLKHILNHISKMVDKLNKIPKLNHVELLGELNDLLWKYDALSEIEERFEIDCFNQNDFNYYNNKKQEYLKLIKNNYSHILN